MIIKSLTLHNYFMFEDVNVELGEDIFFVTGENKDEVLTESNGAGKSLFCQSIAWCLFDDILRTGLLKDDVVGRFDEYCQVVMEIEDQGNNYLIDRVRCHPERGNDVMFFYNGEDLTQHSAAQTAEKICQLLDIHRDTVYHCAYFDSDKPVFPSLTPSKLLSTISEILSIGDIDKYISNCKALSKDLDSSISNRGDRLLVHKSSIEEIERSIEGLRVSIEKFDSYKSERISRVKNKITSKMLELNKEKNNLEKFDINSLLEEYERLNERLEEVETINGRMKALRVKIQKLQATKSKLTSKMNGLDQSEHSLRENLENLTHNQLGICQYCGSEMTGDMATKITRLEDEISQLSVDRVCLDVDLQRAEIELKDLQAKEQDCQEQIDSFQDDTKRFIQVSNSIEQIDRSQRRVESIEKDIESLMKDVDSLRSEDNSDLTENLDRNLKALEQHNSSSDKIEEQIRLDMEEKETAKTLITALKDIKDGMFNTFIYDLQGLIQSNLDDLTMGDYISDLGLKKGKLTLTFASRSEPDKFRAYGSFSKGERAKISTAVSNALNQLLDVGFLVNDEPFSGVDKVGINHILNFYSDNAANKTFIFVGHQSEMKDYFNNYKHIKIVKENGRSTVEIS